VNFIIGDHTAVEVKVKVNISPHDIKALQALAEGKILKRYLFISSESGMPMIGAVTILPYKDFLDKLRNGDFSD
jgi:hypothetical protein